MYAKHVFENPRTKTIRRSWNHVSSKRTSSRWSCRATTFDDQVRNDMYLVLGKAHCFVKDGEGKLQDHFLIEPIGATSLESMRNGAKTCFEITFGIHYGEAMEKDHSLLPKEFQEAVFCDDFEFRAQCAARTWTRPHAQENLLDIVPLGQVRKDFNVNFDDKRVINVENIVTDDDNIKQDISIDVYGRKKDEEEVQATTDTVAREEAVEKEAEEEEDDGVDSLLGI